MAPIIQTQVTGAAKEAIPNLKWALTVQIAFCKNRERDR